MLGCCFVALTLLLSCQSAKDVNGMLADAGTRKELIDTIANNEAMSKEMMQAMMTTTAGKMAMPGHGETMMENHAAMMSQMQKDPAMMKTMMSDMMEACKKDSSMMQGMCKMMMDDPQMMNMMKNMKAGKMDMQGMKGMDTTKMMDHKSHH